MIKLTQIRNNLEKLSQNNLISTQNITKNEQFVQYLNLSCNDSIYSKLTIIHNLSSLKTLIISRNNLKQIPSLPIALQYVDVSYNSLKTIPMTMFQLKNLSVLKINSNAIQCLTHIPQISQIYILNNPIKYLYSSIFQSNIQVLNFDWMFYFGCQSIRYATSKLNHILKIFAFKCMLNLRQFLQLIWTTQHGQQLSSIITFAILKKHYQLFSFLSFIDCYIDANLKYKNKLIFEYILVNDHQQLREYFSQCIFRKQTQINYLRMTCKHNNFYYFQKLLLLGFEITQVDIHGNNLCHQILENFSNQNQNKILKYILKNHPQLANQLNKRLLNPVMNGVYTNPNSIYKFLIYLKNNMYYSDLFEFERLCGDTQPQNLLHYSCKNDNYHLIQMIIQLKLINPFIKNYQNKEPKKITQFELIKKLLIKYEKQFSLSLLKRENLKNNRNKQIDNIDQQQTIYQHKQLLNTQYSSIISSKHQLTSKPKLNINKIITSIFTTKSNTKDILLTQMSQKDVSKIMSTTYSEMKHTRLFTMPQTP